MSAVRITAVTVTAARLLDRMANGSHRTTPAELGLRSSVPGMGLN